MVRVPDCPIPCHLGAENGGKCSRNRLALSSVFGRLAISSFMSSNLTSDATEYLSELSNLPPPPTSPTMDGIEFIDDVEGMEEYEYTKVF